MALQQTKQKIYGVQSEDNLSQLFNFFNSSQSKSFDLSQVYLNISQESVQAIKTLFQDSPVKQLSQVSILNEFNQRQINFDS